MADNKTVQTPHLAVIPTGLSRRGHLTGKVESVLLDIYGTLFISGSGDIGITETDGSEHPGLNQLLLKFGIENRVDTIVSDLRRAIEDKHLELKTSGIDFPEVEIDKIWMDLLGITKESKARDFAAAFERLVNPVYPMPHLKELLSACTERKIRMGIISNAQFYTPDLFRRFLGAPPEALGFHPELVFYSYRLGTAKPSIQMFHAAANRLRFMGIPLHRVLFVGNDMLNDIYPAQKVGFQTGLFAGDKRSLRLREDSARCKNLNADIVVTDLIQLLDYL
ncbi:MAG: HAD family hydrolase [Desulfobacterales bacterium]